MTGRITSLTTYDVRFPTSRGRHGSDAMNPEPDYSAAYVVIGTDSGVDGHGLAFTIGRGNDVQVAAIQALEPYVAGYSLEETVADMGGLSRRMVHDSQLRWLGPEKGVMHMAIAAVINAAWDLKAKLEGKPLWQVLAGMSAEELVDLVDFRYLSDALSRDEALTILRTAQHSRAQREQQLLTSGYPAYATSPGWLGYGDARLARLARQAVADGFGLIKLKVGANLEDDRRRLRVAREAVGPAIRVAVDANQRWDVGDAIEWIRALAPYDLWWVEEPTSPDDVLGHASIRRAVTPIKIATGEHVHNRVMFKQLLQAQAIDVLQLDAARGWCSTWPCSTWLPCRDPRRTAPSSTLTTCMSTSWIPWSSAAGATWPPGPPVSAPKCGQPRYAGIPIPRVRRGPGRGDLMSAGESDGPTALTVGGGPTIGLATARPPAGCRARATLNSKARL